MRRTLAAAIALMLTLATAWLVYSTVSVEVLFRTFRSAHWTGMLSAFALTALVQWIRAWRFSVFTFGVATCPNRHLVRISFKLNFLNFVLPFRLGELGYPVLMGRAFGQKPVEALGVLLLTRVLDLCVVGAILFGMGAWLNIAGSGLSAAFLAAVSALLILIPSLLIFLGSSRLGLPVPSGGFLRMLFELGIGIRNLRSLSVQVLAVGLSFVVWLIFGFAAVLAARSVTRGISTSTALFGAAAGNLAFALPVNGIAGLGPSQVAWVAAVTKTGVSLEDAIVGALAVYVVTLTSAVAFGTLAFALDWVSAVKPHAK